MSAQFTAGQALGHYRIVAKLGQGGMGVVYRARDEHLDRGGIIAATAAPPVLRSRNHAARLVTQLFPGTASCRGSVAITATAGIAALTVRQNSTPLSYTTLPVAPGAAGGAQPASAPLRP